MDKAYEASLVSTSQSSVITCRGSGAFGDDVPARVLLCLHTAIMFRTLTPSLSSFSGPVAGLLGGVVGTTGTPPKSRQTPGRSSPAPSSSSVNLLSRATVSLEYASLRYQSHCPLGMYIIPFVDDPFIWDAVLFIHQGEP